MYLVIREDLLVKTSEFLWTRDQCTLHRDGLKHVTPLKYPVYSYELPKAFKLPLDPSLCFVWKM